MNKVVVFLVLGIFFSVIGIYIFQNFTPLDTEKIQEIVVAEEIEDGDWESLNSKIQELARRGVITEYLSSSAYLGLLSLLSAVFSFFTLLHLLVDKLFFKNFYETPSLFNAVRRGIFLDIAILLVIYMHIVRLELYMIILAPVTVFVAELVFTSYFKTHKKQEVKTASDRTL